MRVAYYSAAEKETSRMSFLFRRGTGAPLTLLLTIVDDTPIAGAPHHVADVRARISAVRLNMSGPGD